MKSADRPTLSLRVLLYLQVASQELDSLEAKLKDMVETSSGNYRYD
jgi:hypothetical protein